LVIFHFFSFYLGSSISLNWTFATFRGFAQCVSQTSMTPSRTASSASPLHSVQVKKDTQSLVILWH